jgi:hypothetical protein
MVKVYSYSKLAALDATPLQNPSLVKTGYAVVGAAFLILIPIPVGFL